MWDSSPARFPAGSTQGISLEAIASPAQPYFTVISILILISRGSSLKDRGIHCGSVRLWAGHLRSIKPGDANHRACVSTFTTLLIELSLLCEVRQPHIPYLPRCNSKVDEREAHGRLVTTQVPSAPILVGVSLNTRKKSLIRQDRELE